MLTGAPPSCDSVGNLEQVALFGSRTGRAHDAPQRPGDPALLADHLADVIGRDVKMEDDRILTLFGLDTNGVRLVDEPASDPYEKLSHRLLRP